MTVSWVGLRADLVDTCKDGSTPSNSSGSGVMTTQSDLLGCLVTTSGWLLGLLLLLVTPAGVVFWFVAAVAASQMITVVRDCWDIWAARAQKVNGWHSCALTSRNTTQMRWDCGPWPWG